MTKPGLPLQRVDAAGRFIVREAASRPARMVEERVFDKWMGIELGSVAKALVSAPAPIGDLVLQDEPTARTRGGELHAFDRDALHRMSTRLSALERRRVKVPIWFWVDKDHADDAFVQDAPAQAALKAVGAVPPDREPRDGKLWLSLALARETANRFPTLFQFVFF